LEALLNLLRAFFGVGTPEVLPLNGDSSLAQLQRSAQTTCDELGGVSHTAPL
jgi:hypothetical protein